MILRRIIDHVKSQNWTAVALDFVIVVMGVFIGIQVANWNAARADKREYRQALARVLDEAAANLEILDRIDLEITERLEEAGKGLHALRSCDDSEENRAYINIALQRIGSTNTIHLQDSALEEITSAPKLLSQQDAELRSMFAATKFNLSVLKTEADFAESLPFRDRMESNPILRLGDDYVREWRYFGIAISRVYTALELASPVHEACQNDQLLKSFYTWQRFQTTIPAYSKAMRAELNNMISALEPLIAGDRS